MLSLFTLHWSVTINEYLDCCCHCQKCNECLSSIVLWGCSLNVFVFVIVFRWSGHAHWPVSRPQWDHEFQSGRQGCTTWLNLALSLHWLEKVENLGESGEREICSFFVANVKICHFFFCKMWRYITFCENLNKHLRRKLFWVNSGLEKVPQLVEPYREVSFAKLRDFFGPCRDLVNGLVSSILITLTKCLRGH